MRWPTFILVAVAAAITGCGQPGWERMQNPDLKGKAAMAAIDSFAATNGWNMSQSPIQFAVYGRPHPGYLRGLPWSTLKDSSYPALTSKGIFYAALKLSNHNVTGLAYNPNTNRFPKGVTGFKPLADHWYVWTFVGDAAEKPKLTRRYE